MISIKIIMIPFCILYHNKSLKWSHNEFVLEENFLSGFTLRIKDNLMRKFRYLCSYEHRSANQQLLKMIEETVREFEEANGEITDDLLQEFFRDNQDKWKPAFTPPNCPALPRWEGFLLPVALGLALLHKEIGKCIRNFSFACCRTMV